MSKIFIELFSWVGIADATGLENRPLLVNNFGFSSSRETGRAWFVDHDVVNEGVYFGREFEVAPAAEARWVLSMADHTATYVATCYG